MNNRFKPWRVESGIFGGLIIGLAIVLGMYSCMRQIINPHNLKIGDCYEYAPGENPFEKRREVYKCLLDIKAGHVKFNFILRNDDGSWHCIVSSDTEAWFNSRLYVKSERKNEEFCT